MAKIYYDSDIEIEPLTDMTVGIIGYGNQGRAHALNLRDSGLTVRVATRPRSETRDLAAADGFDEEDAESIAANCDVLAIMLPDELIAKVYVDSIEPYLASNKVFVFAHGFSVHHKTIRLPEMSDVLLAAPTGPGRKLRSLYEAGRGLPALIAVEQDASGLAWQRCLAYAKGIGCARAGAIETTFAEETVTDLYCEQAVLCGGIPELIKRSFSVLVEAGYQPELAYISCLKEVKLIADLLFEIGVDGMRAAISNTAKFGSAITGPYLIDESTSNKLRHVLAQIENGNFGQQLLADASAGSPVIGELLKQERHSHLAKTGRALKDQIDF
ncbi:MAG TPA: ketol-acid reductoisomerase [Planktothrix sp.]|jgi:ketol-acid reductoisomerase